MDQPIKPMLGQISLQFSDVRGIFLTSAGYKVLLKNGLQVRATSEDVSKLRALLRKQAAKFVADDKVLLCR